MSILDSMRSYWSNLRRKPSVTETNHLSPKSTATPAAADFSPVDLARIPALVMAGRTADAERILHETLQQHPDSVDALHFMGLLCHQTGRSLDAIEYLGRAVTLAPDTPFIHSNFSEVLRKGGKPLLAEKHARKAVEQAPGTPDFLLNLALTLTDLRRFSEALPILEECLNIEPERVSALSTKAIVDFELSQLDEALDCAHKAHVLSPEDIGIYLTLIRMRQWACEWENHESDLAAFSDILQQCVDDPEHHPMDGISPLTVCLSPVAPELCRAITDRHAANIIRSVGDPFTPREPVEKSKLRIGYVSADFHSHPTMHLMNSMFKLHDRMRFDIYAWSIGPDDGSQFRKQATNDVDRFIDIREDSARRAAERIREAGVDILIDLKGYTHDARPEIFALRAAPLQVAWLGYPGTTGAGINDYAIVDRYVVPPAHVNHFSEKLVWLPHSYQVNDHRQPIAEPVPERHALGLPRNGFVFACFNHVYKIEPSTYSRWMRILARVENSVLWLYGSNETAMRNLRKHAVRAGIQPERIVFGNTLGKPEHLARLSQADLFLDTFACNAHTSASDALWAGVPVLTCPGDSFASRVATSLVNAAGLPALACDGPEEYERMAVHLANHPDELAQMRKVLLSRAQLPLFDTPRFVRDLESAFNTMWLRHRAGLPPTSFSVSSRT